MIFLFNLSVFICSIAGILIVLYICLFPKKSILVELEKINESLHQIDKNCDGSTFTFFLVKRKIDYWVWILKGYSGTAILLSIIAFIIQGYSILDSTDSNAVHNKLLTTMDSMNYSVYVQFVLLLYGVLNLIYICHTVHHFKNHFSEI